MAMIHVTWNKIVTIFVLSKCFLIFRLFRTDPDEAVMDFEMHWQ